METALCFAAVYVIEALIAWQYFHSIFEQKRKNWQLAACLLVGYSILFVISQYATFWTNTASFFIINVLIMRLFYGTGLKESIFHSFLMTVIMQVTELLVLLVLGSIFEDFNAYQKEFAILVMLAVLSKLLYFILMQICIRLFGNRKEKNTASFAVVFLLCAVPFASMFIILTMVWIGMTTEMSHTAEALMVACSLLLPITNIFIFGAYRYNQDLNQDFYNTRLLLQKEEADTAYFQMLENQYENQRILIHDIRRHLQTIGDLASENGNEPIGDYIDKLQNSPALQSRERICSNRMLNLILARYSDLCKQEGVGFHVDVRDQTVDFINASDMSSLFNNLLSNALEAATGSADAFIELIITRRQNQKITTISLVNSCRQEPKQLKNGDFETSKPDKAMHGVGIKSIRHTIKEYGGSMKMYYQAEDNTFHTMISMEQKKTSA